MEAVRTIILLFGWPVLVSGSIFLSFRTYAFYKSVKKNVWGKLVVAMVIGWLLTMYCLGLVSSAFMLISVNSGTVIVLPIFAVWFVTMIIITRTVLRWNDEAVRVNDFNANLQSLVNERTKELSDEKQTAEAERNKLKVVIASITEGVLAIDLDHKIILGNKAIETLTGYGADELIGKIVTEKLHFFEDGKELGQSELCPIRKDGFEGMLIQKNKIKLQGKIQERTINLIVSQITEGIAVNLGCIMTFHDATKEQELEEMRLDFVSMAAHELRTPLTAIRGYASLMQMQEGKLFAPESHELVQRLVISSENLGNLIENLLNVSRIERNTFTADLKIIDLKETIKNAVDSLTQQAETRSQKLDLTIHEPLPKVFADAFRIRQVLVNLIANAITYTPEKGQIRVEVKQVDDFLEVRVIDTGEGIPKEALPKLFTKFFRVSGVLEQGSKGTGLGLYISKSIIELHKGKIWAESEFGKGSAFIFQLPIMK